MDGKPIDANTLSARRKRLVQDNSNVDVAR